MADAPFRPSPQQERAFEFIESGSGSAVLEAVAGAGKTTTLREMLRLTTGSIAFCAYNKAIADEIKAKVAPLNLGNRVRCGTLHSIGNGAMWKAFPNAKIEGKKLAMLAEHKCVNKELVPFVTSCVSMAKQIGIGALSPIESYETWLEMIYRHDLQDSLPDGHEGRVMEGLSLAQSLLRLSNETCSEFYDFDDMVYVPVQRGLRMWGNDYVFLDEAQDTNPVRRALTRMILRRGGRLIAVGDPHQAIYGFTGADSDSLELIKREFKAITLPLTTTYRCPKAVVKRARHWVGHIEAHESAPEGIHRTIKEDQFWGTKEQPGLYAGLGSETMILCRNTKPLISVAYALLRRRVGCYVEGRAIGDGLLKLVSRWKTVNTIAELRERLEKWGEAEIEKAKAKGNDARCAAVEDQVECLKEIMGQLADDDHPRLLRTEIEMLFGDTKPGEKPNVVVLCTIHRSKGRERPRIIWWGSTAYSPSRWARQEWQLEQEDNLCYVAATRAQEELIEVIVSGKEAN